MNESSVTSGTLKIVWTATDQWVDAI